jgi:hypothetical protein
LVNRCRRENMKVYYEECLSLFFKGNRSYVHGTDIYNSMLTIIQNIFGKYPSQLTGSFHKPLNHNGILRIYEDYQTVSSTNFNAFFLVTVENNIYSVSVKETDNKISLVRECHEEEILKNAVLEDNQIKTTSDSAFTYIEEVVAMTKKLHLSLYPDADGKWLFTKIKIGGALDPMLFPCHEITVRTKRNFHFKLTQNTILIDNIPLGDIWFSLAA